MTSKLTSTLLAALSSIVSVSAHGHISTVTIDGKSYTGFEPTWAPWGPQPDSVTWSNGASDNGYVPSSSLQSPDIICHLNATNAALTAPVSAGSNVVVQWNQWPESHKGPIIDYLADCGGNCSSVDKTKLKWFKIDEKGQLELGAGNGKTGKWASDMMMENNLTWTVTIPSSLKSGNYVLRHELIALHGGGSEGQTQMYPQCINLEISGTGTKSPSGIVGTKLYTSTDPGILYNIYNDEKLSSVSNYKIPGPAIAV
ncbi:glycoside hydrolase [Annulohypoxylon moriforme]|nr:glycoside hydrolase [Annulohypoxylon moriforme]